ncbi:YciI family protein [Dactylosporangium sucinum]|uniref:YCII-related domain-containing protein n=1 Tax=Dactylosporangium sucinum TaxID=1424081 RepID=A0A917UEF6_9ACTN|nr:YciI family protein [Dactylosporangium sucinum]GGM86953.1 hypothetical protein GCM10007977_106060 [Dactylosporangium sucinum]
MSAPMTAEQVYARMARLPFYVVLMQPTGRYQPDSEPGRELMRAHLQWQLELEEEGRLLAAGPLNYGQPVRRDHPIVNAGGMYIIAAASDQEAAEIAAQEPFAVAGWRTYVVCSWLLNEGVARECAAAVIDRFGPGGAAAAG